MVANKEIFTFDIVSEASLEGVISEMRILLFCTGQRAWNGKSQSNNEIWNPQT